MTEQEIIERIQKGDERMLDFLYKKNYRMMINLVVKNKGTEEEAKDVYQDALVVFWQKAQSKDFVLSSKISTYLYSICQNLWRKELDRKNRMNTQELDDIDKAEIDNTDKEERIKIVQKCLNSIGETCRTLLMYYYFDDLSMQEIADKMGFANADTAKTRKYKCKQELDNKIKELYTKSDILD
jgi:RNA polymerase sigma factor (sigma-70 family)